MIEYRATTAECDNQDLTVSSHVEGDSQVFSGVVVMCLPLCFALKAFLGHFLSEAALVISRDHNPPIQLADWLILLLLFFFRIFIHRYEL